MLSRLQWSHTRRGTSLNIFKNLMEEEVSRCILFASLILQELTLMMQNCPRQSSQSLWQIALAPGMQIWKQDQCKIWSTLFKSKFFCTEAKFIGWARPNVSRSIERFTCLCKRFHMKLWIAEVQLLKMSSWSFAIMAWSRTIWSI